MTPLENIMAGLEYIKQRYGTPEEAMRQMGRKSGAPKPGGAKAPKPGGLTMTPPGGGLTGNNKDGNKGGGKK